MIQMRLERFLKRRCTLLGVGPMSTNCVDAAIELANEYEVPIFLVASRRQIDAEVLGGGYVNNWTTEEFSRYVLDRDAKGWIILARDHGGPWQNGRGPEVCTSLHRAMESAKRSFEADIVAGFQCLHIDPSVDVSGPPAVEIVLERIYELYEFCWRTANRIGRDVLFEIGTEEQTGTTGSEAELEQILESVSAYCARFRLPMPTFVVVQTGTRVMETRNVGSFDSPVRVADELPAEIQVPKVIDVCQRYGVYIKEHNADYLSNEALRWHPRLGIHAINVAPEFGVIETRALLRIMEEYDLPKERENFIALANASNAWAKWILPQSRADDYQKAIICGHYVFASDQGREIKARIQARVNGSGKDLDQLLRETVKKGMLRYLRCLRLVREV